MKSTLRLLFALVFGLGLFVVPSHAIIKQVSSVSATASTILTPGVNVHTVVIQNNGSGNVRLTIDGGSVNGLTNPTATTGYKLVAGAQLVITYPGDKRPPTIRAILGERDNDDAGHRYRR
jgi:hypothetical protein